MSCQRLRWECARIIATVLLLTMNVFLENSAAEGRIDTRCLDHDWIAGAKHFVVEVTGAPIPAVCVSWVDQKRLNTLVASAVYGTTHKDAAAAFLPARTEIILADNLVPSSAIDRSYLVHELVHAQQYARGAEGKSTCIGLLEGEAYSTQSRYLRRHALMQEAFLFQIIGMLQSACGLEY